MTELEKVKEIVRILDNKKARDIKAIEIALKEEGVNFQEVIL